MLPQLTIVAIGFIGAALYGVAGFFGFLVVGWVVVLLRGLLLRLIQGGGIPKKVKDETLTDFMSDHPTLISDAFPELSPFEAKKKLEALIEDIAKLAARTNPHQDHGAFGSPQLFLPAGRTVANDQITEPERILVNALVDYLKNHKLWFRDIPEINKAF